jgi:hypothetical protein
MRLPRRSTPDKTSSVVDVAPNIFVIPFLSRGHSEALTGAFELRTRVHYGYDAYKAEKVSAISA